MTWYEVIVSSILIFDRKECQLTELRASMQALILEVLELYSQSIGSLLT
jgi:hypothetical protein